MKARKYNAIIEQYTNPPIMIDIVSGNRIVMWNATEKTDAEIEAQGFSEVRLPELFEGKQYSEIKEDENGFYCDLVDIPVIPQPTPYDLFQWEKCAKELYDTLSDLRQVQLHTWQYTIIQLMQVKNFTKLKSTIDMLEGTLKVITIEEKELFYGVMLDNGIDLNDYKPEE